MNKNNQDLLYREFRIAGHPHHQNIEKKLFPKSTNT